MSVVLEAECSAHQPAVSWHFYIMSGAITWSSCQWNSKQRFRHRRVFFPSLCLQLSVRCGLQTEGSSEEAVQAFPVSDPQPTLVPWTQAAQAHETWECECSSTLRHQTVWFCSVIDSCCCCCFPFAQVIGLLDVFTPAATLEEFNEL